MIVSDRVFLCALLLVSYTAACRDAESSVTPAAPAATPRAPAPVHEARPEPAAAPSESYRVRDVAANDTLNLRASPDAKSAVLAELTPDARDLVTTGRARAIGRTLWREVQHAGQTGWANERYLERVLADGQRAQAPSVPLSCVGTEPFWHLELNPDGVARCSETCAGPDGLRVAQSRDDAAHKSQTITVVTREGKPFLSARMEQTGDCSDGMSDNVYPWTIKLEGVPGTLEGCCQIAQPKR